MPVEVASAPLGTIESSPLGVADVPAEESACIENVFDRAFAGQKYDLDVGMALPAIQRYLLVYPRTQKDTHRTQENAREEGQEAAAVGSRIRFVGRKIFFLFGPVREVRRGTRNHNSQDIPDEWGEGKQLAYRKLKSVLAPARRRNQRILRRKLRRTRRR